MSVKDSLKSRAQLAVGDSTYLYHSLAQAAETLPELKRLPK